MISTECQLFIFCLRKLLNDHLLFFMLFWLGILLVALVGNIIIAQRYHSEIYEYMLLSVVIGPFSWIFQLKNRPNGNL